MRSSYPQPTDIKVMEIRVMNGKQIPSYIFRLLFQFVIEDMLNSVRFWEMFQIKCFFFIKRIIFIISNFKLETCYANIPGANECLANFGHHHCSN